MKVTIVTATTGRDSLYRCVESVKTQTHKDIQHLIMVDGVGSYGDTLTILDKFRDPTTSSAMPLYDDVIFLPMSVGKDRWNGHRMYAAGTYLADGEYIMYLDDDNIISPNHIESCLQAIQSSKAPMSWAYSLRQIVAPDGRFLCYDDCESLGPLYPTIMADHDHLVDVNCYFIHKTLAVYMTPLWYRKAREPGVLEVDRALVKELAKFPSICTGVYSVSYTVGSTDLSVTAGFFQEGNKLMAQRYPGGFPWRR